MKDKKIYILSTRPLTPSLIEKAAAYSIIVETDSFINTIPLETQVDKVKALEEKQLIAVFTSMNAVDAVAAVLNNVNVTWKIFSIGTTTAKLIREKFPESVMAGQAENASSLADQILSDGTIQSVTFFCGDQRRDELPEKLKARHIQVNEIIVYKTIPQSHKVSKHYDAIMFFSPSAVDSFFKSNSVPGDTKLFSIGDTSAKSIEQYSTNKVIIGDHPSKEELLNKVILHYTTINEHK